LRRAFEVIYKDINQIIGAPYDYIKNKASGNFPTNYNLRIPGASSGTVPTNERQKDQPITERLSKMEIQSPINNKPSGGGNNFANRKSAALSHSDDQYMPIKALSNFSTDWRIKARIVKKHEMRHWKNDKGSGEILSVDLMDRENTMIQATMFKETATKYQEIL